MTLSHILSAAAAALTLALPGTSAAEPNPAPQPIARLKASISPSTNLHPGTPLRFTLDTQFATNPPNADLVLQRLVYRFPHGTVVNGRLFPSCDVLRLQRAHGRITACPAGSRIGSGTASGTAIALGVRSNARVTMFNGPGGHSIVFNVAITAPALIDASFAAPFVTLHGRWANKLTVTLPDALKTVLDGDIVTSSISATTGTTRIVHGVRRGYVEALACPRSGRARISGDFSFSQDTSAHADAFVPC